MESEKKKMYENKQYSNFTIENGQKKKKKKDVYK